MHLIFQYSQANSADDKLMILFSFFFPENQKIGFDFSCKLSPEETSCLNNKSLFLGKMRKIFQKVVAAILLSMLSVRCNTDIKYGNSSDIFQAVGDTSRCNMDFLKA